MIASSTNYEKVNEPEHAAEAGRVLGHFQRIISDFPTDGLADTLPGFHIAPATSRTTTASSPLPKPRPASPRSRKRAASPNRRAAPRLRRHLENAKDGANSISVPSTAIRRSRT